MEGTPANESDGEEEEEEVAPVRSDRGSDTSSVAAAWKLSQFFRERRGFRLKAAPTAVGERMRWTSDKTWQQKPLQRRTPSREWMALVQVERDRWEEEKQALEARIEDLKAQLRSMQATHQPDAEKEALKKEYQDLRKAMKARSRFGAWVCARHMMESEDEELWE
eukprot:g6351.t1